MSNALPVGWSVIRRVDYLDTFPVWTVVLVDRFGREQHSFRFDTKEQAMTFKRYQVKMSKRECAA